MGEKWKQHTNANTLRKRRKKDFISFQQQKLHVKRSTQEDLSAINLKCVTIKKKQIQKSVQPDPTVLTVAACQPVGSSS